MGTNQRARFRYQAGQTRHDLAMQPLWKTQEQGALKIVFM